MEIVHALSDRANQTTAEYEAKAEATWVLAESFQPRDVIDLLLSGQLLAFNAVFADATRGLLDGMEDTLKKQTLSSLVSIGRVTQGHVDRLAKRGNQPYRTEVAAPVRRRLGRMPWRLPITEPPSRPRVAATPRPAPGAAAPRARPTWCRNAFRRATIRCRRILRPRGPSRIHRPSRLRLAREPPPPGPASGPEPYPATPGRSQPGQSRRAPAPSRPWRKPRGWMSPTRNTSSKPLAWSPRKRERRGPRRCSG